MSASTLPVEGWVDACASYGLAIVRLVVSGIRDDGPLGAFEVKRLVQRAGVGADVKKASPNFDEDDGAERVVNFLVADLDVIRFDGATYAVDAEVREAFSTHFQRFFTIPSRDEQVVQREAAHRTTHLRRWLMGNSPFAPGREWANGIRQHDDADIVALADLIAAIGYCGEPIVKDQNGVTMDGHAREAALTKLGVDPAQHTVTKQFRDDRHRLAYIVAVHYVDGKLPTSLRDGIKRYINKTMSRSGIKVDWGANGFGDFPTIVGEGAYTPQVIAPLPPLPPLLATDGIVEPMVTEDIVEVEPDTSEHVDLRVTKRDSAIFQAALYMYEHDREEGWSSIEIQNLTGIQIHRIGSISKWKQNGWLVATGSTYPGKRAGQPVERLQLTAAGRQMVERMQSPYHPSFRNDAGRPIDRPGSTVENGQRLEAVRLMSEGRWLPRQALARLGRSDYSLRRQMWFMYNGTAYIVVPDVLQDDWKQLRIMPLTHAERLSLVDAGNISDEALWGLWDQMVTARLG